MEDDSEMDRKGSGMGLRRFRDRLEKTQRWLDKVQRKLVWWFRHELGREATGRVEFHSICLQLNSNLVRKFHFPAGTEQHATHTTTLRTQKQHADTAILKTRRQRTSTATF